MATIERTPPRAGVAAQENTDPLEGETHPVRDILVSGAIATTAVLTALWALPILMPNLAVSLTGTDPKVYWYVSRGSAIAAYWLLWISMVFGVMLSNKLAQAWPGPPRAFDFHQYVSLLGIAFVLFHAFLLMGDHYIQYSVAQVLVPFASEQYRPIWVGLGQLGMYLWAIVNISHYVRKQIGRKAWRWVHYTSFACYMLGLIHGIAAGTDTAGPLMLTMYWMSGAILLVLCVYRVIAATVPVTK
jgi:predicted ferric reductase